MDYRQVRELIQVVQDSSLTEFSLKLDNAWISMRKDYSTDRIPQKTETAYIPVTMEEPLSAAVMPEEKPERPEEGHLVTSPIVGTFYQKSAPDKPDFVHLGDEVKQGDVLCIIEAMKVMNEITCDRNGIVAEILVQNEQMVEYGQPLFRLV